MAYLNQIGQPKTCLMKPNVELTVERNVFHTSLYLKVEYIRLVVVANVGVASDDVVGDAGPRLHAEPTLVNVFRIMGEEVQFPGALIRHTLFANEASEEIFFRGFRWRWRFIPRPCDGG